MSAPDKPQTLQKVESSATLIRQALTPYRWAVLLLVVSSLSSSVAELGVIGIIAATSGRILTGHESMSLLRQFSTNGLLILGGALATFKLVTDIATARLQSHLVMRYESSLRSQVAELQSTARWTLLEDGATEPLQVLLWTSIHRSREAFTYAIGLIASSASLLIMIAGTIVAARLMTLILIFVFLVFALAFRPLINRAREVGQDQREFYTLYAREVNETLGMSRESRVLGIQRILARRLSDAGRRLASTSARQAYLSSILSSSYADALYLLIFAGLGVALAIRVKDPAPIAAVALLLYRSMGYGRSLQGSLQSIAAVYPYMADVDGWISRLSQNQEIDTDEGSSMSSEFAELQFSEVSLIYPNGNVGIRRTSFRLARGETIALVGPSGSGKSSIVSLLLGLRDPSEGEILVDGVPLAELNRHSWRSKLAFVPQETTLFNSTIADNVRCWRDISDERIRLALQQAHVLEEVLGMENGLDTQVGEGGKRLSGGQRQRICLARALASDPTLLILDEPTSALDPLSERAVRDALNDLKGTVTMVIIAHRMTTIAVCDRILVLERGRLEHDGLSADIAKESTFVATALALTDEPH